MALLQVALIVVTFSTRDLPGGWRSGVAMIGATVASVALILALPAMRIERWLDAVATSRAAVYALLLAITLLLGGAYIFVRGAPVWDEAAMYEISRYIAEHGLGSFFQNYTGFPWLGHQHPPLIPMLHGEAMRHVGFGLMGLRAISLAFTVGVVLLSYELGRRLYG